MDTIADHLRTLIERLAEIQQRSPHDVGRRVGGTTDTYLRLCRGRAVSTTTASRMLAGIRRQWPEGLDMPDMPKIGEDAT